MGVLPASPSLRLCHLTSTCLRTWPPAASGWQCCTSPSLKLQQRPVWCQSLMLRLPGPVLQWPHHPVCQGDFLSLWSSVPGATHPGRPSMDQVQLCSMLWRQLCDRAHLHHRPHPPAEPAGPGLYIGTGLQSAQLGGFYPLHVSREGWLKASVDKEGLLMALTKCTCVCIASCMMIRGTGGWVKLTPGLRPPSRPAACRARPSPPPTPPARSPTARTLWTHGRRGEF